MCAKLSRLPASWFSKQDPGAIASRFVGDVDTVEALFASGVVSMAADVCRLFSILLVIFTRSKGLGLLLLAAAPLLFWMTRVFQKRMLKAQELRADPRRAGTAEFCVSDRVEDFERIASLFLQEELRHGARRVDIEQY